MEPSLFRTSSTFSRIFEPGEDTLDFARICALRIRVIKSLIGSCVDICFEPPLPARLHEAGNQSLGPEFAQRNAGQLALAVVGARPSGELAAVADARGRRVARH